jgi:hypothetical protein
MNPFEMVVLIVAIVTLGGVIRSKNGTRRGKGGARPVEDHVLKLRDGFRINRGSRPLAGWFLRFLENGNANGLCTKARIENEHRNLQALIGRGGRGVPAGLDDAGKRIRLFHRHEGERVQA